MNSPERLQRMVIQTVKTIIRNPEEMPPPPNNLAEIQEPGTPQGVFPDMGEKLLPLILHLNTVRKMTIIVNIREIPRKIFLVTIDLIVEIQETGMVVGHRNQSMTIIATIEMEILITIIIIPDFRTF